MVFPHCQYPLLIQGVNLGFGDVASLASCVEDSLREGGRLGQREYLARYETERQRHNLATMAGNTRLSLVNTSNTRLPLVNTRNTRLSLVNFPGGGGSCGEGEAGAGDGEQVQHGQVILASHWSILIT